MTRACDFCGDRDSSSERVALLCEVRPGQLWVKVVESAVVDQTFDCERDDFDRLKYVWLGAIPTSSATTMSIGNKICSRRRPSGIRCSGEYRWDMGSTYVKSYRMTDSCSRSACGTGRAKQVITWHLSVWWEPFDMFSRRQILTLNGSEPDTLNEARASALTRDEWCQHHR
jgi:hypothetical protein